MDRTQFEEFLADEPELRRAIVQSAGAAKSRQFTGLTETAAVVLMFPVLSFVLQQIGLPWLHEAKRFSELYRQKVHQWIDERYRADGFDPDAAEEASEALLVKLEQTTNPSLRAAWERLREAIGPS